MRRSGGPGIFFAQSPFHHLLDLLLLRVRKLYQFLEAAKARRLWLLWPYLSNGGSGDGSSRVAWLTGRFGAGVPAILPADRCELNHESKDAYQSTQQEKAPEASEAKPDCSQPTVIIAAGRICEPLVVNSLELATL